jgi:hypothetical protein
LAFSPLFYPPCQLLNCIAANCWMIDDSAFSKDRPWTNSTYYIGICLEELRKIAKTPQHRRCQKHFWHVFRRFEFQVDIDYPDWGFRCSSQSFRVNEVIVT